MYPMTFDEFLTANGEQLLLEARNQASPSSPLPTPLHEKLIGLLRTFMLVGGMPESVAKWVETHDYLQCQEVQDDIVSGYEADFPKYKKKVDSQLLRMTMRSAAQQATKKFMFSQVPGDYKTAEVKKALELLIKANILIPVTHTNSNGLPLGDGRDDSIRKILVLDTGLLLRLLNMAIGSITEITTHILTATASDLVNKGPMAEMLAGLELLHYRTPNLQHELFYWLRQAKNATAEVDYIMANGTQILPFEVKAGVQGGMKSLWDYMRERRLSQAIRCSLENFGQFDYTDDKADGALRHVCIFPLYAIQLVINNLTR
jgi:predicted AAA+ superfamily ATPase